MLARPFRFHGHGSLRHVQTRGKVVRGQWFTLKYAASAKRKKYRAAVVVSKKVHKSAVTRNRIRRRIYEVIRTSVAADGPAFDIVFIVYSEHVAEMNAAELKGMIREQLQKAGIPLQITPSKSNNHDIVEERS